MTRLRAVAYAVMCVAELIGSVAGDLLDRVFPPEHYPPSSDDWTDGT